MRKNKILKKITSYIITAAMVLTVAGAGRFKASAFDTDYISKDGMALGYSIINGYSKLAVKNNAVTTGKSAVYSGLDITNPYILTLAGMFYIGGNIDIDKVITDNSYALSAIEKLDSFLKSMRVKNERAEKLKSEMINKKYKITSSFDTLGLYIFETDKTYSLDLMNCENVDFVLAGGEVPKSMKDLDFDGKSGSSDVVLIQKYLVKDLQYSDSDEMEYVKFACDINGDKELNINDATYLQRQSAKK